MSVIGITFMCISMNDETLFSSRNKSEPISKLITLVGFAFRDTNGLRFAKAVGFIFRISFLLYSTCFIYLV